MHKINNVNVAHVFYYFVKIILIATNVIAFDYTALFNFQPHRIYDVSCHSSVAHEIALAAEDEEFPEQSIFFIETSCRGGLDSRQACAVESAARANPEWQINVLFAGPISELFLKGDKLLDLEKFDNVRVRRIHITKYVKETPLETYLANIYGLLRVSNYPVQHASDVLRMLTLYKYGGVYLDLDMITVKSFNTLPKNWVTREFKSHISSGAIAASKRGIGRNFTIAALRDIAHSFDPKLWNHNGPGVVTRVLHELCSTKNLADMRGKYCHGIEVILHKHFYPIHYFNWKDYFRPGELNYKRAFTHHLWNFLSHRTMVSKDSLYTKLAQQYCPTVYGIYGDTFGLMRFYPNLR